MRIKIRRQVAEHWISLLIVPLLIVVMFVAFPYISDKSNTNESFPANNPQIGIGGGPEVPTVTLTPSPSPTP